MAFNINFKRKLFFYYFSIFFIVTIAFIAFQYNRERQFKIAQLENSLNSITELSNNFISSNDLIAKNKIHLLDSLLQIMPTGDTRLTLIDVEGVVLFDNFVDDYTQMENHLNRPEINKAKLADNRAGSFIRESLTTGQAFYYYAHYYNDYYIRAAVVYDIEVKKFLKAEKLFFVFIAFWFVITWLILSYVTGKMSESITKLKDFAVQLRQNKPLVEDYQFPKNELGVIGKQIVSMYKKMMETKDALSLEKEKLIRHLYVLNEGIGFFSSEKDTLLTNTHFVQYLNLIGEKSSLNPQQVFEIKEFKTLHEFLHKYLAQNNFPHQNSDLPQIEFTIKKSSYYFEIKCILFQDKSFEIYINDTTKLEKRKLLKQQMTSNIAHELKTPVTSVSGYLETILNNKDIEEEKKDYFIKKATKQCNRLSALIEDIVLLNRIEEAGDYYERSTLAIAPLVQEFIEDREKIIKQQHATITLKVDDTVQVKGNKSLLSSVFQNLLDNALAYAGENVKVTVEMYHEDDAYYYFSVRDNGLGIPKEHMSRVFERFYRVDAGRSRKMGGTGLGLAIVKHAVNMHRGEVSVKNGVDGGAEFYFNLPK
ncbi:cell wall metabolism sensor histidine kinase WalK [Carboxylicivirga sp. M1479]|uniref:sensor histidine kinase n=1 Tax=Carboxylicivirga sp. M1479 TaxID=2594476 RepID=UPI001178B910|nr:ATP-binding protein [Carboxylicivirga sp. M1479]TRX70685.1 two-component sensor histidine kinase [Carboxylicivirga sp. M1479]